MASYMNERAVEKKVLTLEGLTTYNTNLLKKVDEKDTASLNSAKSYTDALKNGQVNTNKTDIAALKTGKADKATTLAGYGISDAYTKAQTDAKITTEIGKAGHLKREIVTQLPEPTAADEHTIYMVAKAAKEGQNEYDEYMVVTVEGTKKLEKIGDSKVDLTNYATKAEVSTAKQEAIDTASGDATTKANKALTDAKAYSDGLAKNYATAAQGAKADSAVQQADVVSGTGNGTISVKGTDVPVKGLKSAAYTDSAAYEKAGSVSALEKGQVATNKNDITAIKGRLDTLEGVSYVEISEEEILALFA